MSSNSLNRPILVVDDEADIRDLMEITLLKMGLTVETAEGVREAKAKLDAQRYSLVLTDMRMPDGSGLEVVEYIIGKRMDTPVAVITAFGNADQAVQALNIGAFDYLQKPITLAQLRTLVKSAIKIQDGQDTPPQAVPASAPNEAHANPLAHPNNISASSTPRLLGNSPQIAEVRRLIEKLAESRVPVYISGESGSGKEQAARSIHEQSDRRDQPFIAVNCGAIPENLMESEFFGYKRGSFTGADHDRSGFFQHADGGTLFLDEVADLPLAMQVKLLRAIQEKAVRRIGDAHETPVDVRIICATHKNLEQMVAAGLFRQDLFYRINVVQLNMPPLREMREDLSALIRLLLHRHNPQAVLSQAAQQTLLHYSYPGNFRELENIIERATALAGSNIIQADDLQIRRSPLEQAPVLAVEAAAPALPNNGRLSDFHIGSSQIQDYLDGIEREIIELALKHTDNNRTQAAKLLGISFRSMRYRLERLLIE